MSKTETLRQSALVKNETRLEHLGSQIETLRKAKHQSAEELTATLEPLAQALAALTDETRQTLIEIDRKSREQVETFTRQLAASVKGCNEAAAEAQKAANSLNRAGARMEWRHYLISVLIGITTAAFASVFWLWAVPSPKIDNQLDAKALAEYLKPAVIEVLRPSRGR